MMFGQLANCERPHDLIGLSNGNADSLKMYPWIVRLNLI